MATAVGILMLVVAVSVFAYPIFRSPLVPSQAERDALAESEDELLARRDVTYTTLKELDLDLEMGKLSATDHQALRDHYRAQAVSILQELDACQAAAQADVAEERESAQGARERDGEAESAARWRAKANCLVCGAASDPDDRFCRRCGAALEMGQI